MPEATRYLGGDFAVSQILEIFSRIAIFMISAAVGKREEGTGRYCDLRNTQLLSTPLYQRYISPPSLTIPKIHAQKW